MDSGHDLKVEWTGLTDGSNEGSDKEGSMLIGFTVMEKPGEGGGKGGGGILSGFCYL